MKVDYCFILLIGVSFFSFTRSKAAVFIKNAKKT